MRKFGPSNPCKQKVSETNPTRGPLSCKLQHIGAEPSTFEECQFSLCFACIRHPRGKNSEICRFAWKPLATCNLQPATSPGGERPARGIPPASVGRLNPRSGLETHLSARASTPPPLVPCPPLPGGAATSTAKTKDPSCTRNLERCSAQPAGKRRAQPMAGPASPRAGFR